MTARRAVHQHNSDAPDIRGAIGADLSSLLANIGQGVFVEAPFHCAYGANIHLGDRAYLNAGCTFLDTAPIHIGADTLLGPGVQIYCAEHHKNPDLRAQGLERALPVTVGLNVWIGGGAILLPGVTIGDGALIGAGSVVTRDVPSATTVVGTPARMI